MIALDLFAGTGWGVACQRLGIEEFGVENMPAAIATREANGMKTIFEDVWEGLEEPRPRLLDDRERAEVRRVMGKIDRGEVLTSYDLLIASPPCQTFSMAGNGAGRRALDEVLLAISERDYLDPAALRAFGEKHDEKTALVLTPLAYIARDLPRLVVLEQVPTVLPVWEAYAHVMRRWGYSVKTAVLNAEQYGVPQTRKRAILMARWDAEATLPTPTHSRYYPTDPSRLDEGVKPWISMAEALGWGRTARPSVTVTGGGTETGGAEPLGHLSREVAAEDWVDRATIERHRGAGMLERHDERKGRPVTEPALTVTGNASGTTPGGFRVKWQDRMPARTVTANGLIPGPGMSAHDAERAAPRSSRGEAGTTAQRVTIEEASRLQSYPEGFVWGALVPDKKGALKPMTKSAQFLQVGNAVPPLLAEAILKEVLA